MARWLAPESTTQGAGRPRARNSSTASEPSQGLTTDSRRAHEGGPGSSTREGPRGRGSNTSRSSRT
eukprot:13685810-Alexandrium_andersonii.AAC.1